MYTKLHFDLKVRKGGLYLVMSLLGFTEVTSKAICKVECPELIIILRLHLFPAAVWIEVVLWPVCH